MRTAVASASTSDKPVTINECLCITVIYNLRDASIHVVR